MRDALSTTPAAARRPLVWPWQRVVPLYGCIALLHVAGWGLFLYYAGRVEALVGLGAAAYTLGLRHAFDADHVAVVDDSTRYLLQNGRLPLSAGFFFSLGHSSIVFALTAAIALAAATVKGHLPALQHIGGLIGAGASGTVLWIVGALNLRVLLQVAGIRQEAATAAHDHTHVDELLARRGFINRLAGGRLQRFIKTDWQMYPLGALFGLGFDTASEIGLLALTAGGAAGNLPVPALFSLPLLFAAGMTLMDTTDGVLMVKAYGWAAFTPGRKLLYNVTVTGISVLIAFVIGAIQLLHMGAALLHFDAPSMMDSGVLGASIVMLFLLVWLLSVLGRKTRSTTALLHRHEHTHADGTRHSHDHWHG